MNSLEIVLISCVVAAFIGLMIYAIWSERRQKMETARGETPAHPDEPTETYHTRTIDPSILIRLDAISRAVENNRYALIAHRRMSQLAMQCEREARAEAESDTGHGAWDRRTQWRHGDIDDDTLDSYFEGGFW